MTAVALQILALCLLESGGVGLPGSGADETRERPPELAVIVHPDNPVREVTLAELREYLKMERQFWKGSGRCVLFLRPSTSVETRIALDRVYRMTAQELRRYWVSKLFTGEIHALPSVVRTSAAAASLVKRTPGSLSLVLLKDVVEGVRVLKVDGKAPGEDGYALVLRTSESTTR